ncbi:hypothetical protein F5877DRAFT_86290 [Lentinula edodes]|nr:hypothetical protein F5877DRAFT_86290 [Lentinula edodes]
MAGIHNREDHSVDPDEVDLGLDSIFIEVPRLPSPEATFSIFQGSHKEFRTRPVGSHPLWGHYLYGFHPIYLVLWNSVLSIASYLEQRPSLCQHKSILELGAGGALPSLVAAESGARKPTGVSVTGVSVTGKAKDGGEENEPGLSPSLPFQIPSSRTMDPENFDDVIFVNAGGILFRDRIFQLKDRIRKHLHQIEMLHPPIPATTVDSTRRLYYEGNLAMSTVTIGRVIKGGSDRARLVNGSPVPILVELSG